VRDRGNLSSCGDLSAMRFIRYGTSLFGTRSTARSGSAIKAGYKFCMNIIHVTHRAWPVIGGSERYVQEIARRQALDGHRVTIVATEANALSALWDAGARRIGPEALGDYQGVRIQRLPVRYLPLGSRAFSVLRRLTWLLSRISRRAALRLAKFSPWVPDLAPALNHEQADLLFAWNILFEGLTAAVACEAQRRCVPWIAVPLLHLGRSRFYTMDHQLHLLRQAARVIAQTDSERAFLLQHGLTSGRVCIVSPGLNLDQQQGAKGRRFREKYGIDGPLLVTLGALGYEKGTMHLLAATQRLWGEGRRLTAALIGPTETALQSAVMQLPEEQRGCCLALVQVPEDEKWDAVDAADVVVLPSRTESFGIVFLEAWMRGKPVIGARAGAVEDVIRHGVDGLLVEFGDVPGLAKALRTLLDNPVLASEMGERGRDKVRREYTWDQQYERLRAVVDQVIVEWKR
jgi:glycogen(starch) synthase